MIFSHWIGSKKHSMRGNSFAFNSSEWFILSVTWPKRLLLSACSWIHGSNSRSRLDISYASCIYVLPISVWLMRCWLAWHASVHQSYPIADSITHHGQWWSILRIQRWHTEQWCARSGLILQHFGHLKNTWPSLRPICCIISLVAFPFGTAPCNWMSTLKNIIIIANSFDDVDDLPDRRTWCAYAMQTPWMPTN